MGPGLKRSAVAGLSTIAVAATAAIIIAAVIADSVMSSATSTAAVKLAERGQPTRATSLKSGSASRQGQ